MEDFDLTRLNEEELIKYKNKYTLKLSWFGDIAKLITKDKEPVALIEAYINEDESILQINNFEVLDKRKGIGTEIINNLKNSNYEICLYVDDLESKLFWESLGFEEYDDGTGTPIHCLKK